jgi:hypothetical protein
MSFGLAPSASPYARLARMPPACTGCRVFQLTPEELPPILIGSYALQQCLVMQLQACAVTCTVWLCLR